MKLTLKRLLIIPIAVMMMLVFMQVQSFDAFADPTIVARFNNPVDGPAYSSVHGVNLALESLPRDSYDIYMTADWGNERLEIPSGKHVTLYMQSHKFDRGLSQQSGKGWEKNGENIYVGSDATLTIYGGPRDEQHSHNNITVHNSTDENDRATHPIDGTGVVQGGVITGGDNTNGGGAITIQGNSTVSLNQVTIAGCRSEETWSSGGYGGAIWLKDSDSTVNLVDTRITGCQCQNDGGGIYANWEDNIRINLTNSRIDHNYARSDGGGINPDGEKIIIKGDGKSEIAYNKANEKAGGIFAWNDKVNISKLMVHHNEAAQGGGIYLQETGCNLSDLEIKDNVNGGVYIANKGNTLSNCTVTGNSDYGVRVTDSASMVTLSGKTVIKENVTNSNLSVEHGAKSHFTLSLSQGSDIHIHYDKKPEEITEDNFFWEISDYDVRVPDYRHFFTSDDTGYCITYSFEDYGGRSLNYTRNDKTGDHENSYGVLIHCGYPITHLDTQEVAVNNAGPTEVGKVYAGGETSGSGDTYDLMRGYLHREKTSSGIDDMDNVFYYSDGLFYGDPYKYNDHLATASWNLAFAGTYLRVGEAANANNNIYYNKHAGARQFLSDIGVPDQRIYVNDCNIVKPGTDTIGVTIGSKYLQKSDGSNTGDILVPVTVRGGGYEAEWASNVKIGSGTTRDGEAQGFSEAADQVMDEIHLYIAKYGLEDEIAAGKVKFWVSGFSRAGATANITSKRLIEEYATGATGKNNQVFGYPCEAAKGGTDNAEKLSDKTKYYSIHNLINGTDIVPLVGPVEMGFKRYGVDHYIPGKAFAGSSGYQVRKTETTAKRAGSASETGTLTVTTYRDNDILYSKGKERGDYYKDSDFKKYDDQRSRMIAQLATIDPSIPFGDYFIPQGLNIASIYMGDASTIEGSFEEYYIEDFLSFMQSSTVTSRKVWAEDATKIGDKTYGTIQQAARDSMALLFSMSSDSTASAMERAMAIKDALSFVTFSGDISIRDIYDDVIGEWHERTPEEKMKYINYFWSLIEDSGALDFLPEGEAEKLEYNWPTLANMIFTFVDGDWEAYPVKWADSQYPSGKKWAIKSFRGDNFYMMYALTLSSHMSSILANHCPEINMAWTRTYDSYYYVDNDLSEEIKPADKHEFHVQWIEDKEHKEYEVKSPKAYKMTNQNSGNDDQESATGPEQHTYAALTASPDDSAITPNYISSDERLYLEVGKIYDSTETGITDDLKGEAIYYTLQKVDKNYQPVGAPVVADELYRGGLDFSPSGDQSGRFKLAIYAMSYGDKSRETDYYLNVDDDKHVVKVRTNKGSDPTRSLIAKEDEIVTLAAETFADRYFTNWTIEVEDTSGETTDVTSKLLGSGTKSKAKDLSISFTMPAEGHAPGEEWPEDYSLIVTANYGDKVTAITLSNITPTAGSNLAANVKASFDKSAASLENIPVTWTYKSEDNKDVAQAGGTPAYGNTVYTATVNIPQDAAAGRYFADGVIGDIQGSEAPVTVTRNDSDGSATLTVSFTTGEGGSDKPTKFITLKIVPKDPVSGAMDPTTMTVVKGSNVLVTAPAVQNMIFDEWNNTGSDITVEDEDKNNKTVSVGIPADTGTKTELIMNADYNPVLSQVTATLTAAPEAGVELPEASNMRLKIKDSWYTVDSDNVELTWTPTPADGKAKTLTSYTATAKLKPYSSGEHKGKIHLKAVGSGAESYIDPDQISYSDSLTAKFTIKGTDTAATFDTKNMSMSMMFDPLKYTLRAVKNPDSFTVTNETDPLQYLKDNVKKVKIVVGRGMMLDADVTWTDIRKTEGEGGLESSEWLANGTFSYDGKIIDNPDHVAPVVFATVRVEPAPAVSTPRASLESGTYLANQVVTLSCKTAGAKVWYTTDGSDPATSSTRKEYKGEQIYVDRYSDQTKDGVFTIRTYAILGGYRNSNEGIYEYRFTNDVSVPAGRDLVYNKSPQVGVSGSLLYSIEPVSPGVTIDRDGNAVATEVGTYKVRLKLNDEKLYWIITNPDGSTTRTRDDQIVEFTIHAKPVYSLTFDLSGGVYKGHKGTYTVQYEEGTEIKMPKPTRKGYTFRYWKGSRYKAGAKYTVKEDHAFKAVWKKGSGGAGTGDSAGLIAWGVLLGAALLGCIITFIIRRKRG